jgi:geranylgeranyl diphosphate synthase type I
VAESNRVVDLVQSRINEFLLARQLILSAVSSDLAPLVDFSRQFLSGGKRFRATFCYWGAASVGPLSQAGLTTAISAASALEVFHAAALVHDDIIDNSDTRRGAASAHKLFARLHAESGWAGSDEDYGRAAATLLGDLMLGWSDELLDEGLDLVVVRAAARRARDEFNRMRTEVTAGQYLDILEERAWLVQPEAELLDRALRVITFKSAKYSVQAPLQIGAALAGGTDEQLAALGSFGLPLGIAYQLRDDLLGVFGDTAVTGKPSGDDLREGKRTVLVALARAELGPDERGRLDSHLGDPALTAAEIETVQDAIRTSGAVDRVEELIAGHVGMALAALADAPLAEEAKQELAALTEKVTRRAF